MGHGLSNINASIKPLAAARNARWAVNVWSNICEVGIADSDREDVWQAWIDRGISPLFTQFNTSDHVSTYLSAMTYFADRDAPISITSQGWLQWIFDGADDDHQAPAKSLSNGDFTYASDGGCPSQLELYDYTTKQAEYQAICQSIKDAGITPVSWSIDFESGAKINNASPYSTARMDENRTEAQKCPRCTGHYDAADLATNDAYSLTVDDARAYAHAHGFVTPVHNVFPSIPLGAYWCYPIDRAVVGAEERYTAGWYTSGLTLAQYRHYFSPNWGGAGASLAKTNWNVFLSLLDEVSTVLQTMAAGDTSAVWLSLLYYKPASKTLAASGYYFPDRQAWKEAAIHLLLRGVDTFHVFVTTAPDAALDAVYDIQPDHDLGEWILNVQPIQDALREILCFQNEIAGGTVLNYTTSGTKNTLDDTAVGWSGIDCGSKALIRTVSFGTATEQTITVYGNNVTLPTTSDGEYHWVYTDGTHEEIPLLTAIRSGANLSGGMS